MSYEQYFDSGTKNQRGYIKTTVLTIFFLDNYLYIFEDKNAAHMGTYGAARGAGQSSKRAWRFVKSEDSAICVCGY